MNRLKWIIISIIVCVHCSCFSQIVKKDYLLIHYVHVEEFFPNNTFFIPLDSSLVSESQLVEMLNDTSNRIYVDLAYIILHKPEKIVEFERFVNKILSNNLSLFYISKKNNLKIHRVTITGTLENESWDTLNSIFVPYFIMNNNRIIRSFREVKDKKVLSDIPLLR